MAPKPKAIAYLRTSSAANIGADKDTAIRQRQVIERYAKAQGYEVAAELYDAAVSGADPVELRPGFAAVLDRIEANGIRVILVESIDRFARDLTAGVVGIAMLRARGVTLIDCGAAQDLTNPRDPMVKAMIQIALTFAELEKSRLVAKLKGARDRKRAATGRCEGRPPVPVETIALARRLARRRPKGGQRSLREIAAELAKAGHLQPASGKPYFPASISRMVRAT